VSLDEAYLEFPPTVDPIDIANRIRADIFNTTRCTASAGISYNMFLARMATKKAKPNGTFQLKLIDLDTYLPAVPIGSLPGVGWVLKDKLHSAHINTCGDIRRLSKLQVQNLFGEKTGQTM
jgi:DNA repair protein REV1